MDALQLETFSLSYRWLVNNTDGNSTAASFIDIDPRMMSLRWTSGADSLDDFDFDIARPDPTLAHADEIFSGGVVLPLQPPAATDSEPFLCPDSALSRSTSVDSSSVLLSLSKRHVPPSATSESGSVSSTKASCSVSSTSKNVLRRYLCFLMPLLKKVKQMRARGAAAAEGRRKKRSKVGFDQYRRPSLATVAAVVGEDLERSIHEAVLHCKKSIGTN